MKTMKLIYPLAFALAITLATTGCHNHKAVGVTALPGQNQPIVGDNNGANTLPPGGAMNHGQWCQRQRHSRRQRY